jgi:hypothetical protein
MDKQKAKRRMDPSRIEMVDDLMAQILREKSPDERIEIGFKLWTSARKMLTAHLKSIHPEWDDHQISHEVAKRLSHGLV